MIENMRKYTGLMIVVFVLLLAGFLFTMGPTANSGGGGGMGSGPTVLEVHGRALDQQSYRRMGESTLELASEAGLHTYVNFLMVPDARQLQQAMQLMRYGYPNYYRTMGRNLTSQDFNRFIANRIIVQKTIEEMGIYASDEEVTETIKTSQRFSPDGKFNEADYATFVDKRLGKLGMTEKDLREIVRENLCLNELIQIIGGGLLAPRNAVSDQLEAQAQTVTLARIVFNRDDYVEKEKPTEEEIKAYWETHQDAYKTEEQRRINYILLTRPSEPEEKKAVPTPPLAADATPEQQVAHAAAETARLEAEAKAKGTQAELRAKAGKKLTKLINTIGDDIYNSEEDKKPLDFDVVLTKHEQKATKSALFTQADMPKEIAELNLRGNVNRGKSLAQAIFEDSFDKDPYDNVSDALPVGEHGWIIFTLEEVVEPELLDYAAARDKARAQLISENATKKVKEAAKAARDSIVELMKTGKGFDAAAKEKGLVPVQVGPFSMGGVPPKDEPSHRQLHQTASGLNPGEVSEPIDENDRSLFVYVDKREIEDTEESKRRIDFAIENNKGELMTLTFLNWINHQYAGAEVKGLSTEQQ